MDAAYRWLAKEKARFVVQSFRSTEQALATGRNTSQGIVEDLYVRRDGWFVAQSAGNGGYHPPKSVDNEACPWSMNALCVGSSTLKNGVSCFSSWKNPGSDPAVSGGFPDSDREEPDLLTFGGNTTGNGKDYLPATCTDREEQRIILASSASDTGYTLNAGTSFSTPVAGAVAALVHQYCAKLGVPLNGLELRNTLMLSANRNANGWTYSTLKPGTDAADGAGILSSSAARAACDSYANIASGGGPVAAHGTKTVDTGIPGQPLPAGEIAYPSTPPGVESKNQKLNPATSLAGISATPEFQWNRKAGEHIRFVLSWNSCTETTRSPNLVGVDFDVFLYSKTRKAYLYASQSNDDNNEGFDVVIPAGWDGDFVAYVAHPDGAKGCADSPKKETFTWSTYQ